MKNIKIRRLESRLRARPQTRHICRATVTLALLASNRAHMASKCNCGTAGLKQICYIAFPTIMYWFCLWNVFFLCVCVVFVFCVFVLAVQQALMLLSSTLIVCVPVTGPVVAQRVGRGITLLFHDRGTRRGWVVSSTPRPYFTPGKDPVPIVQEVGWAPGPVSTGGKSRPTGIQSPDRPDRSTVAIPTELPGPQHVNKFNLLLLLLLLLLLTFTVTKEEIIIKPNYS